MAQVVQQEQLSRLSGSVVAFGLVLARKLRCLRREAEEKEAETLLIERHKHRNHRHRCCCCYSPLSRV